MASTTDNDLKALLLFLGVMAMCVIIAAFIAGFTFIVIAVAFVFIIYLLISSAGKGFE